MSNPHRISIFLILLLFLGLIFVAVSALLSFPEDAFALSEALVQVQVQTPRHYDSSDVEEPVNYLLASKRRIHSCDPFTADEATVYYVPSECSFSYPPLPLPPPLSFSLSVVCLSLPPQKKRK